MTQKVELKIYKEKSILDITEKNALYCIKGDNDTTFRIFVTDKFGNIVYLKDDTGGGGGGTITNIISSDETLEISGTTVKDIKIASSVLSTINSALQAGDNVSALINDANYITLADIPAFNPSDYDLTDFTNTSVDRFAKLSDITFSGSTNLGYTASPTQGSVTSDTGTDATIPLANNTNAGLLSPTEKSKLAGIENGAEVNNISDVNATDLTDGGNTTLHHHDSRYYTETETDSFLSNKVDKVSGKQLSTEDYTTAEKTKLAGIADGAEVNVNADWNATSGDAQILNKPTIPDVSGLVPYTGATSDVDLGEHQIKVGQLEFDQTPTGTAGAGKFRWNDTDGTLDLGLKGGNVTLQLGQEQLARVVNKTSPLINLLEANYQVVKVVGATGQRLSVALAQADSSLNSAVTLGVVTETINANQEGFVTTGGQVREINTTGSLQGETWADGDILYLSPTTAGALTKTRPSAPNKAVIIGFVEYAHANHGKIYVKVDTGITLDELDNVTAPTPTNNDVLAYNSSTQIWENKTVVSALGFTPENSTNKGTVLGNLTSTTIFAHAKGVVDYVASLGYWVAVNASSSVAGIMKLFTSTGTATDGTMTQKAITDALATKANTATLTDISSTATYVGWSSFTTKETYVLDYGSCAVVIFRIDGVSNSATTNVTLPFTNTGGLAINQIRVQNNSAFQSAPGNCQIGNGSSTLTFVLNNTAGAFTASGNKSVWGQITILK